MELKNRDRLSKWLGSWQVIAAAALCVWLFSAIAPIFDFIGNFAVWIGLLLIAAYAFFCVYILLIKKKRSAEMIFALILFGSLLLRAYFVLAVPYDATNHDIGQFTAITEQSGDGHFGYIDYIFKNGSLPDFDPRTAWSFYNPPGYYLLSALQLWITSLFKVPEPYCYEALQSITFFFSAMSVWMMGKIFREFSISGKFRNILMLFTAIHPFFYTMASVMTNDCMAMFFMFLCLYMLIRWYKKQNMKNILLLALALGLGMFTKFNAVLLAPGIAFVFIWAFFTNSSKKKYPAQYGAFLGISVPLGMFYPVRNLIMFGMPLFYVQSLEAGNPQEIVTNSLFSRLILPPVQGLIHAFQSGDGMTEVNVWIETIRTSLFDEYYTMDPFVNVIAMILFIAAIILAVMTFVYLIKVIISKDILPLWQRLFIGITYFTLLISLAIYSLSQAFVCTMHYRYIPAAMLFPLICTGAFLTKKEGRSRVFGRIYSVLTIAFSVLSLIIVFWLALFAEYDHMGS